MWGWKGWGVLSNTSEVIPKQSDAGLRALYLTMGKPSLPLLTYPHSVGAIQEMQTPTLSGWREVWRGTRAPSCDISNSSRTSGLVSMLPLKDSATHKVSE